MVNTRDNCIVVSKKNKVIPLERDRKQMHIVYVSDNGYADFLGVAIHSIILHANSDWLYDIIVITTDFSEENSKRMVDLTEGIDNISVRVADISELISGLDILVSDNYNVFTFYRLLLPDIVAHMDRVLYMDADTIVQDDLTELYNTSFDGNYIIGTYDVLVSCWQNYNSGMRSYFKIIGVGNSGSYVQAGVLLFNIKEINNKVDMNKLIEAATRERYIFNDQDLINVYFKGKIKIVGLEWDVLNLSIEGLANCEKYLNQEQKDMWNTAMKKPKIIHYVEKSFPCYITDRTYSNEFWEAAKNTVFYERLYELSKTNIEMSSIETPPPIQNNNTLCDRIKNFLKKQKVLTRIINIVRTKRTMYSSLNLECIDVVGDCIKTNDKIILSPGAEISCLHCLWGNGYHAVELSVCMCDKKSVIDAYLMTSYRHETLDKTTIHVGDNILSCKLDDGRVDVELYLRNVSENDMAIDGIKLIHK